MPARGGLIGTVLRPAVLARQASVVDDIASGECHLRLIGFTVSLFFATAAFPEGSALSQTKMGALLSFLTAPLALGISRITRDRAS